jgi:flagellar hook assembly protein FlgD
VLSESATTELAIRVSPNPTRADAVVQFRIGEESTGPVQIEVYDAAGRHVRTLLDDVVTRGGTYRAAWDGRDAHGAESASGVYFVKVRTRLAQRMEKITLLR